MNTTEIVARYYAAFNAKNWTAMLDCVSEDVRHHVNEGANRDGKARFADFIAHMDHCYDEELKQLVIMVNEDGSRAAAEFIVHGTYKNTDGELPEARGQKYVLPAGAFFDIRNGEITRVTTYYNLQNWLSQVS